MSVLNSISFILRASRLQIFKQCVPQFEVFRGLYSAAALGIDGFMQQQQRIKNQIANIEEKFKTKMRENVEETSKNIIFTEDLKNMIHITNNNEDLNIVVRMMKKFNNQNKELRFGNFVFGPVVMRLFYILDKPDEALECFKSPELAGFFDQLITYQLLFDMLYENRRYKDLLECFEIVKERQIEGLKYPRNIVILLFAACYKLNNPESLEYAKNLWAELNKVGHFPARRASTFFANLLLKQNQPENCLEVLSNTKNHSYTTVRNLKVLALTKMNRLEDTIPILKSILNQEQVHTFNKDVLDTLGEYIDKGDNTELKAEFQHIMKIFKEQNHISDLSLEEQLTAEISSRTVTNVNMNQNRFQNRNWRPRFPRDSTPFQRTERSSLREME